MKLFTNGCSFTWGGAIYPRLYDEQGNLLDYANTSEINQKRLSEVWPSHLSKKIAAEQVVNLSIGCGSNERIVRTTFNFFSNLVHNQELTKDWVAIIQLSIPHRFEYWDDVSESWALCMVNGSMTSKETDYQHTQNIDSFAKHIWTHFNEKTYSQKYWTQVVGLASFLKNFNIPYWFSNLDTSAIDQIEKHQFEYLQNHVSWLGDNPKKKFGELFEERHDSGSGHPSLLGHRQIANSIYNIIQDKLV